VNRWRDRPSSTISWPADLLRGGNGGDDWLIGEVGGDGSDWLCGGAGDDTLSGGADTLEIRNSGLLPILLTDADFLL
jgi:Ca2+-binding RTX toxin-like protein